MNCTGKTLYKSCVKTLYIPVHVLDVDECDLRTDNCDNNALCTNTPGGFTCAVSYTHLTLPTNREV